MAIKKKPEPKTISLPPALDVMLLKGFTEQFMASHYEAQFKATKGLVEGYLDKNADGFDVEKGVGFKSEYGSVTYTGRENLNVDKDKVLALIESGELTVAQLLASVSTFKKDELKGTLAKHYEDVVTISETEYLTFKANGEFKAKCEEQLTLGELSAEPSVYSPETAHVIAKAKATGKSVDAVAADTRDLAKRAAEAKAKAGAKTKTPAKPKLKPEDDLDAILKKKR